MAVIKSNVRRAVCAAALCNLVMASSSQPELVVFDKICVKLDPCAKRNCDIKCVEVGREQKHPYPALAACDKTDECCCRFYHEQHPPPPPPVGNLE
ncbi:hypothetical protein SETIT_8G175300v2 [Setaria italica]|uniref:Bifunctional inhibitor/plant lipid transfer protein/seed storage helical domain-containing protein n=1 Tax=Setaria italica TaxID=4555 RepID=K3ZKI3_SETIT|nr:hypothetical protein SETIT_8G175300v2 [Setaria italica]